MNSSLIFDTNNYPKIHACHASSLIELPNKDLYATWWAGSYEKARDVSIWGAKCKHSDEMKWLKPKVTANTPNHFDGTPVLYLDPKSRLYLFYRSMHHGIIIKGGHTVTSIRYQYSDDLGLTWSDWQYLRKLWGRVIRCKPLRLPSGRVLLPFHRELFTYQSRFFINDDPFLQHKWKTSQRLKVTGGCLEPNVCLLETGELLCSLRTSRAKRVYFSRSNDGGFSWSKPIPSKIPNPSSQTDILCLNNGNLILACNPRVKTANEKGRSELSLIRSLDNGKTWNISNKFVIEKEEGEEFSYPCIIQGHDGLIHMSYTFKRKAIKYVSLKENECF
ncbi:MAG: hypothetical protein GF364_07460 [Candidatus Lokiarchaeota archaeon]|nr:hypothetical protein [Candidatus Lokiarchaeota archaeon]